MELGQLLNELASFAHHLVKAFQEMEPHFLSIAELTFSLSDGPATLQPALNQLMVLTQAHDFTRQRLEHVHLAIEGMNKAFITYSSHPTAGDREHLGHTLLGTLHIQQNQLDSILSSLSQTEQSMKVGAHSLVTILRRTVVDFGAAGTPLMQNRIDQKVREVTTEILHHLDFSRGFSRVGHQLLEFRDRLLPIVESMTEGKPLTRTAHERLNLLRKYYTMEEEHSIHDEIVPPNPPRDTVSVSTEIEMF